MTATATTPPAATIFPERELKGAIGKWWDEETSKHLNDPFAAPGTLFDMLIEIDSLTAVNVLLVIELILGFESPESLIRSGGYTDRNDMIDHLLPALRTMFNRRHGSND
jgi:hypothetical protein